MVIHHAAWFDFLLRLRQSAPLREAVRLISVSQPSAGAFLNAVPKYACFRVPTPLMIHRGAAAAGAAGVGGGDRVRAAQPPRAAL
jgi:hypothetical protein